MKRLASALALIWSVAMISSCSDYSTLPRDLMKDTARFDSVFMDVSSVACHELHALMVVKDGKVVYERWDHGYDPEHLHVMWSASKTFTAAAVGFAVQDGLLQLTDKVVDYFTDEELPEVQSDWLKKMTVNDLMIMSSGFKDDFIAKADSGVDFDWAKATLASEVIFEPGTRFAYNSMNTYLLSVIVSRVTDKRMDDYLQKKLFEPMGIENYMWKQSPQGYSIGGWGLYLRTEDFAKMGQFFLQKGRWGKKQLLSEEWMAAASSPQIMQYAGQGLTPDDVAEMEPKPWNQGYGYQMWMCPKGGYRLDGAWSQLCVIYPDKNLVIAAQAHTDNVGGILQSIEDRIYCSFTSNK